MSAHLAVGRAAQALLRVLWFDQMLTPSMSNAGRPVVLLVQQSRDAGLEMYAEFLRYHGLALVAVSSAREALLLAPRADIVVTGITLDDHMDGVALVSRLRHDDRTRDTPIVVLSASAWPRDRERAERAGCDVFLTKPCLPDDLLSEVRLLLPTTRARPLRGSIEWRRAHPRKAAAAGWVSEGR